MRLHLFKFAAAVSLIVCLATAALWIRSYWVADIIQKAWSRPETQTEKFVIIESNEGRLGLYDESESYDDQNLFRAWDQRFPKKWRRQSGTAQRASAVPGFWHSIGFQLVFSSAQGRRMVTPHWLWVLLSAILPVIWFASAVRAWCAPAPHQCAKCSYDLTGNASGTCPECGTPVATATIAKPPA